MRKKKRKFEQVKAEAETAGLLDQPLIEVFFSKYERNKSLLPNIFYPIIRYFKLVDKERYFYSIKRKSRERHFNYISPGLRLYVELFDIPIKIFGYGKTPHAFQVKIYSDNQQNTRDIAMIPVTLFKEGDIIEESDWDGIETIFTVNRENCITTWKSLLSIV